MRCRDFWILCSTLLSLVFTILILVPGTKGGVLPSVAIATFTYPINNTVIFPDLPDTCETWCSSPFYSEWPTIHNFFFTVHYLSLCGGFMGGTETTSYTHLSCQSKKLGWEFRSNDRFIVNFGAANGSRPVDTDNVEPVKVQTITPAATLVVGLVCSIMGLMLLVTDICGVTHGWELEIASGTAVLLGVAATSLMLSSALITSVWQRSHWFSGGYSHYRLYTANFIAMTWCAMAFMYVAFVGKVVDNVWRNETRRRMIRRRQF